MTDKTNILFVDTSPTPTRGGAQKSLLSILSLIDKEKFQPNVLMHVPHGIEEELDQLGIPYFIHNPDAQKKGQPSSNIITQEPSHYHGTWRDLAYRIKSLFTIEKKRFSFTCSVIKKTKTNLVYLNGNYTAAHGAIFGAKWMCLPLIAHQRRLSVYTLLDRLLVRWIDRMIMYSEKYSNYLHKLNVNPPQKTVIYNGIDVGALPEINNERTQKYRDEFELTETIPILCQVGTVHPVKNQKLILDAVKKIWDTINPFYVIFVGELRDAVYSSQLKESISGTKLENYIRFVGERNDALSILTTCDVSLEATQAEAGFSRVLIESLCMGKTVVAPKAGCSEIITDQQDGFLYTDGDVVDCARTINDAINKSQSKNLQFNTDKFKTLFDAKEMIQKIERSIQEVLLHKYE